MQIDEKEFILLFLNVHQRIDENDFLQVIDAHVRICQSKHV
jgi:transposase